MAGGGTTIAALARKNGLRVVSPEELTIRRQRRGRGFVYLRPSGRPVRDEATLRRFRSLAVPPAYTDVLLAEDPAAHLQAIGRDAAGRLQYRYHPDWEQVREIRKARRLAALAQALPRIRRKVGAALATAAPTKEFALAAVIELVACSAIRPGSESYARLRGTRGAATLLKSNLAMDGDRLTLSFRAKSGKRVVKEFACPRLAAALPVLAALPGRRLFQYRNGAGEVVQVSAPQVNTFLREIADAPISLKDFRTLLASANALARLAQVEPATSERARRKQVLDVMRATSDDLANTPAICRKSYVHETIVTAFEDGVLERFADTLKAARTPAARARVLAEIMAQAD